GEDDAPLGLVRMRNENLGSIQDVGIALANRFALDRARRIGTARRFRDREEGVPGILDRAGGISALLFLAARVDHRRRGAPEDPASRVVQSHAMLRHFLGQHAHVESAQAAAAVLARRAHAPHACGLHLVRDRPVFVLGNFGRVGIDPRFDRDNLLADYLSHLVAKRAQFRRQYESIVSVHQNSSSGGFPFPSSPRASALSHNSRIHSRSYAPQVPLISGSIPRMRAMASVTFAMAASPRIRRSAPASPSAPR